MIETARRTPLLEFRAARYRTEEAEVEMPLHLELTAEHRSLAVVRFDRPRAMRRFADACCGLILPRAGEARFLGRSWGRGGPEERDALRGRIGRSFTAGAWLDYLTVADNVLLQQAHHGRRPVAALRAEAAELAVRFGLPGLPTVTPDRLNADDLQRAALVRAFLGRPRLVVLEHPTAQGGDLLEPTMAACLEASREGAAVLWLTPETAPPAELLGSCGRQWRLRHSGRLEAMR
jgi:phospholipid/cholesterol/gamma-HCH transport system ATP-binding protein